MSSGPASGAPAPASAGSGQPLANTPQNALFAIIGRLKEYSGNVVKQQKPWTEVLDRTSLSKPANVTEALGRIKKNAAYFKVNYLAVMLTTTLLTFIMHPGSLLVLAILLSAWIYLLFIRTSPLVIGGRQLSDREKVLGLAGVSFVTIFFLTSVGTVFFSAISLSVTLILLHGAFREPDNLFIDEAEGQPILFNILPGVTTMPTAIASVV